MSLPAVIQLDFDPLLRVGELSIPWQAVGLFVALALAIALGSQARRPPRRPGSVRNQWLRPSDELVEAQPLRLDDMGYILLAVLPGAVAGGRLVHAISFWGYYSEDPRLLLSPEAGGLSLLGAVLGGTLTGAWMATMLAAPLRRWADAAAVPLLLALGLGKLAQLLAGSGQGLPFGGPWAVAFVGPGPWTSAEPAMPSHPSQVYEGIWLLVGALLVLSLTSAVRRRNSRQGLLFVIALLVFLLGRVLVGFTWRDERVLGLLNAEQLLALVGGAGLLLGIILAEFPGRSPSDLPASDGLTRDRR